MKYKGGNYEKLFFNNEFSTAYGFFISCASTEPYRPLTEGDKSDFTVIGTVQITFRASNSGGSDSRVNNHIKQQAYIRLREEASKNYQGNIDVRNIIVSYIRGRLSNAEWTATGDVIIPISGGRNTNISALGIEGALARAAEDVAENFTARSRIAIVYITAQDRSATEYITGELEHILRRQGFVIIDRSELDRIRREQNFQMSGEVDDETAVSIGRFSGANIIVTGRVDGESNLQRLRLRALDTTSGQVVGTASEIL